MSVDLAKASPVIRSLAKALDGVVSAKQLESCLPSQEVLDATNTGFSHDQKRIELIAKWAEGQSSSLTEIATEELDPLTDQVLTKDWTEDDEVELDVISRVTHQMVLDAQNGQDLFVFGKAPSTKALTDLFASLILA